MIGKYVLRLFLAVFGLCLGFSVNATTLIVDGFGQLTGAKGVRVGDNWYDVSFKDGSCQELFSGCNSSSDFIPELDAWLGSLALLEQVLLDGPLGDFDSTPSLIKGCNSIYNCEIHTPYGVSSSGVFFRDITVFSEPLEALDHISYQGEKVFRSFSVDPGRVFAVWSVSEVPIPATGWLFMTALLGLVGLKRKREG